MPAEIREVSKPVEHGQWSKPSTPMNETGYAGLTKVRMAYNNAT